MKKKSCMCHYLSLVDRFSTIRPYEAIVFDATNSSDKVDGQKKTKKGCLPYLAYLWIHVEWRSITKESVDKRRKKLIGRDKSVDSSLLPNRKWEIFLYIFASYQDKNSTFSCCIHSEILFLDDHYDINSSSLFHWLWLTYKPHYLFS